MKIVTTGSFLVDAETRLNPAAGSIYFGGSGGSGGSRNSVTTVRPTTPEDPDAKLVASIAALAPEDSVAAISQRFCPVLTQNRLGSMGTPVKLNIEGEDVFLCCEGCRDKALSNSAETLEKVHSLRAGQTSLVPAKTSSAVDAKKEAVIKESLAELAPADRALAESQRFCPVLDTSRLGSMGPPVKLMIEGQPVFLCCEGCEKSALKDPQATVTKAKSLTGSSND